VFFGGSPSHGWARIGALRASYAADFLAALVETVFSAT
jgi:hypothetical protein